MDDVFLDEEMIEKKVEKHVKNNLSAKKSRSNKQKNTDAFFCAVRSDLFEPINCAVNILNHPTPRKKRKSAVDNSAEKLEFLKKQIADLREVLIPGFVRWQERYNDEIIVYTQKQKIKMANSELSKQALKQNNNGPKLPKAALKIFGTSDIDANN